MKRALFALSLNRTWAQEFFMREVSFYDGLWGGPLMGGKIFFYAEDARFY